jgi:hypothetical protein
MLLRKGKGLIIEFFGLPGSGKTTVAKTFLRYNYVQLNHEDLRNTNRYSLLVSLIKRLIQNPGLLILLFKLLASFKGINLKVKRWLGLVLLENYKSIIIDKVIVYDQHLIQYLVSFFHLTGLRPSEKLIYKILIQYNFPKNIKLFYLNLGIDLALSQYLKRREDNNHNKTLMDNLSPDDVRVFMKELIDFYTWFNSVLNKLGYKIIEVNINSFDLFKNLAITCDDDLH